MGGSEHSRFSFLSSPVSHLALPTYQEFKMTADYLKNNFFSTKYVKCSWPSFLLAHQGNGLPWPVRRSEPYITLRNETQASEIWSPDDTWGQGLSSLFLSLSLFPSAYGAESPSLQLTVNISTHVCALISLCYHPETPSVFPKESTISLSVMSAWILPQLENMWSLIFKLQLSGDFTWPDSTDRKSVV